MSENIRFNEAVVQEMMFPMPMSEEDFLKHDSSLTPMANFEFIRKTFPEINIVPKVTKKELPIIPGITLYGFINFFNAYTFISSIDVYVNGIKVIPNLRFSAFSPYYKAFPGYYHIQIFEAGTTDVAFTSTFINIIGYRVYTGAFSGLEDHACMLMINDCIPNIREGRAYLRMVQISPNAPLMNAFLDDALVLSEIDYREVSRFYAVKEGVHTVKVEDYLSHKVLLEDNHLELMNQSAYTIYTIGDFTKPAGLQMMVEQDGISHLEF